MLYAAKQVKPEGKREYLKFLFLIFLYVTVAGVRKNSYACHGDVAQACLTTDEIM